MSKAVLKKFFFESFIREHTEIIHNVKVTV